MANPAHLALLDQGVEAWNAARRQAGDLPDLEGADLSGRALAGIELFAADLRGANLQGCDLEGADLREAWLDGADLRSARLAQARLGGAQMTRCRFDGAVFVKHDEEMGAATQLAAVLRGADSWRRFARESAPFMPDLPLDAELAKLQRTLQALAQDKADAGVNADDPFDSRRFDDTHQARLCAGVDAWNAWRGDNPGIAPRLDGADLTGAALEGANLSAASLRGARLTGANLRAADLGGADLTAARLTDARLMAARLASANFALATLTRADLRWASVAGASFTGANLDHADLGGARLAGARLGGVMLREADLSGADLSAADLSQACLSGANLRGTNLTDADLSDAMLTFAQMVETVVDGARLAGASVYGVAAWGLDLSKLRDQTSLHITPEGRAGLTVDNLELAQFVYLMVHNEKIRGIIDTIGRKAVLILGRFYAERKALLASMSRFVVADVTDAKSIPQELSEIVPRLPSVPVQPILLQGDPGYAMFEHWTSYRTMLPVYQYRDQADLLDNVRQAILAPVTAWEAGATKQAGLEDELKAKDAEIERLRAMLQMKDGGS